MWLGLLEYYIEKYGDASPPQSFVIDGYKLGNWVINLRQRSYRLSKDQKLYLSNLPGWVWDTEDAWNNVYKELKAYSEKHQDCLVHHEMKTSQGILLNSWIQNQRTNRFKRLTTQQRTKLENLKGWSWNTLEDKWTNFIKELKIFIKENNHGLVPYSNISKTKFPLGLWVSRTRSKFIGNGKYVNHNLTKKQISELNSIKEWVWDLKKYEWEKGFNELVSYFNSYSSFTGKTITESGYKLGKWIRSQKSRYRKKTITPYELHKLNKLSFWSWDVLNDAWEKGFEHLQDFVREYQHANPKGIYISPNGFKLGVWVFSQKTRHNIKKNLEEYKVERLTKLPGWQWSETISAWDKGFDYLQNYVKKYKNANVPIKFINDDGFRLGFWVGNQRGKKNRLGKTQFDKLTQLPGWVWNVLEAKWDTGYQELLKFISKEGHPSPKKGFITRSGYGLGSWIDSQRQNKEKLPKDKFEKLDNLNGWMWNVNESRYDIGFNHYITYVKENKTAKIIDSYINKNGYPLGHWVTQQMRDKKEDKISKERKDRLEKIAGWAWTREEMM